MHFRQQIDRVECSLALIPAVVALHGLQRGGVRLRRRLRPQ
jgi:hypothetical protein